MTDLGPIEPCPTRKRGAHAMDLVLADELEATYTCRRCGAMRRVPASGSLVASRLDDLTADEIEARIYGKRP